MADIFGSCEEMDDKRRFEELLDYIHENCSTVMTPLEYRRAYYRNQAEKE